MRIKPTERLIKRIYEFYGEGTCIVRGKTNKNEVVLAHIDDNPANTCFENLIPLQSGLNLALERSKYERTAYLPDDLQPKILSNKAWIHFGNGNYAASYGCNRLACQLAFMRQNDYNFAVECLTFCISSLRPFSEKHLLRHVILLVPDLIEKSPEPIDPFWKAEFLGRIGMVLYDFKMFDLSGEIQKIASQLYAKSSNSPFRTDIELRKAASVRRYTIVNFDNTSLDKLSEIEEIFRKRHAHTDENTTLQVKSFIQFELKKDIKKTMEILEKMKSLEPKTRNFWVIAELHFLLGRVHALYGEKDKAKDEFDICRGLFEKYKIIPDPSINAGEIDPCLELRRLGLNTEYLLPKRGEFFLSNEELRGVVNRVINSQ